MISRTLGCVAAGRRTSGVRSLTRCCHGQLYWPSGSWPPGGPQLRGSGLSPCGRLASLCWAGDGQAIWARRDLTVCWETRSQKRNVDAEVKCEQGGHRGTLKSGLERGVNPPCVQDFQQVNPAGPPHCRTGMVLELLICRQQTHRQIGVGRLKAENTVQENLPRGDSELF